MNRVKIMIEFPRPRSFLCGDKRTKPKHPSLPPVSPRATSLVFFSKVNRLSRSVSAEYAAKQCARALAARSFI